MTTTNSQPTERRIAITGGTGFLGRNIARELSREGHRIVLIARGVDNTDSTIRKSPGMRFEPVGLESKEALERILVGCSAVVHCAGINREIEGQTYQKVHVEGTQKLVEAARAAGVRKVVLISFLRVRPDCGSGYHESKWQAEEIVRKSGLDYTVLKCGVIYGRGDHMLDHLSHAFHTFPVFAFVGFKDRPIRPNAVEDVARIVKATITQDALSRRTVAVVGPEQLALREAVCRVASVVGRRPLMFPLPVWFHYALGWCVERIMTVPLVSVAQVRMLSEGLAEPTPPCEAMPVEIAPRIRFTKEQIQKGVPAPGGFGKHDIKCCRRPRRVHTQHGVFFEIL